MPRRLRQAPLVGRLAETDALDEVLRMRADGTEDGPVAVVIAGDAGIGKSRLAAEMTSRAAAAGWQVLSAGCLDLAEGSVPYLPLVDALRAVTDEELPPVLEHWRRGETEPAAPELSPDMARGRVYAAYLDLLRVHSHEAPIALVVEDVHWADRATRDLLSYLIRGLGTPQFQARVLVLLTYRSDELTRTSPVRAWLSELLRLPGVSRMNLGPLDQAGVTTQLASLGAFDLSQAREIYRRSEGNPFYVEELAALWSGGELRVPEAVRNVADVRVGHLAPHVREMVRLLAAIGRPAGFELLQLLSSDPAEELVAALHSAVDTAILTVDRETSTYRFRHALLADAVLDQFLPGERAAVHAIIAEALTQRPALSTGPSELGYHQAAAGDLSTALASYLAAADGAERVYAFGEAGGYLERALDLWARVPDAADATGRSREDVLVGAAENLSRAGDFDRAVAFASAALAEPEIASDPGRSAEVWERVAWYYLQASNGPATFEAYQTAAAQLDLAPQARGRSRVAAEHALALAIWGRPAEATVQAERALRLAADDGDIAARGLALNASGVAHGMAGRAQDSERELREALELARVHGSVDDLWRATTNLADTLLRAGRTEESLGLCETAIAETEAMGLDIAHAAICRITASDALFALGRWDEAVAHAETVRDRIEYGEAGRAACVVRAQVATARGENDLAASLLSSVEPHGQGQDEPQIVAPGWLVAAENAAWSEHYDEGRAAIAAGLTLVAGADAWYTAQLCALGLRLEADRCIAAHARRAHSEEADARQRADQLIAAVADVVGPEEIEAWVAQARAEYLRIDASKPSGSPVVAWTGVRDRWRTLRHPYPEAYANLRLAESELATGDRRAAARELSSAATLAERLEAAPLAALIADVARRGGIGASRTSALDGLTTREREILAMVVAGTSNRDIATALFISPKTVSVHVSALLRKFGVSGRGDLGAAAQSRKLSTQYGSTAEPVVRVTPT
ncbi:MAG TPA: AAA family ATPase [Propionibacteriaceae bacterium]|nr:AAA family ATPase [Propionibacteriaceae bacterium]